MYCSAKFQNRGQRVFHGGDEDRENESETSLIHYRLRRSAKKNDHCFFFSNPRFVLNILFRNTRMVFSCNFAAQIMTPAYGPLSNLHCI